MFSLIFTDDTAYILETPRLLVRRLTLADADVIIDAFNTPGFLSFVGDRGMTSPEPALKVQRLHGHRECCCSPFRAVLAYLVAVCLGAACTSMIKFFKFVASIYIISAVCMAEGDAL